LKWIFENTIPDAKAISRLPNMMEKLIDTVLMSIMSTVTAGILAFFFAIMASLSTRPNSVVSFIVKIIASVNRNIPVVAWAMIFLLTFGQSSFTGFLALFFASFGFLTKAFMESIDDTSSRSVEALTATGASYYIRISPGCFTIGSSHN
jgi:phosphonate transport system permease protein